jgi:hypothetical protein
MKKFIVALTGLFFLSLSIFAQTATRPRIVTAPTPQTDSPSPPAAKRPPVLLGDTRNNSQNQTSQPNKTEEPAVDDDEVIKIETSLVTFPVSVLDREGRFISGLQKQDFQIFENGVEQKIDEFASVEKPFSVILLIDNVVNRIVKRCAVAEIGLINRVSQHGVIIRQLAQNVNSFVKRNHHNSVVAPQLVNKSNRRVLNFVDLILRRRADINQQNH